MVAVQPSLLEGERLFAFLDDIYVVCAPSRVGEVYLLLQRHLLEQNRHTGAPGQDEDLERRRFEAPKCRRFNSKRSREPPQSRGVERRPNVGRLWTRFERPWCSSRPPAARCSTVEPTRENSRPSCLSEFRVSLTCKLYGSC